jgi:hypothetical protein
MIYVDDILCVHHEPGTSLPQIDRYLKMKPGSIMEPTFFLGPKLKKTVMPNGVVAWGMISSKYAQTAVQNVQECLQKNGNRKLKKKKAAPFKTTYTAEIEESPVLGPEMENYFQSQVGILCWCVELGRIDIITEVPMLSTLFLCHVNVTWMLCITCLHTCPCTTMQEWCLTLLILMLTCVLLSILIGSPCMGTSRREYHQTLLSQKEKQLTYVHLWILTMQDSTSRVARGQAF